MLELSFRTPADAGARFLDAAWDRFAVRHGSGAVAGKSRGEWELFAHPTPKRDQPAEAPAVPAGSDIRPPGRPPADAVISADPEQ
jgi:hypothetical protein